MLLDFIRQSQSWTKTLRINKLIGKNNSDILNFYNKQYISQNYITELIKHSNHSKPINNYVAKHNMKKPNFVINKYSYYKEK